MGLWGKIANIVYANLHSNSNLEETILQVFTLKYFLF